MSRTLSPDNLLKLTAGMLLALLVWQGKGLCDRLTAVERTQNRICVRLGIDPIAWESLTSVRIVGSVAAATDNPVKQNLREDPNNSEIFP